MSPEFGKPPLTIVTSGRIAPSWAGRAEAQKAAIDAATECEIIRMPEELVIVGSLQRNPEGRRMDRRAVDSAIGNAIRERNGLAVFSQDNEGSPVRHIWKIVRVEAKKASGTAR